MNSFFGFAFPFSRFSLLAELKSADCKFYMEEYLEAKAGLFDGLKDGAVAVLNRAEPASEELAKRGKAKKIWYGFYRLILVRT